MARPVKPEDQRMSETMSFALTKDEHDKICRDAGSLSLSQFLRGKLGLNPVSLKINSTQEKSE